VVHILRIDLRDDAKPTIIASIPPSYLNVSRNWKLICCLCRVHLGQDPDNMWQSRDY
jgi:hypothetical protein